ncbi:uncharacterized protein F4817DRAFT_368043 [Daldinia loculata]|uniref:uncharacterized protein n=1 Tax=Daldinia loculata TaxID=103429 RepID=UPI0020C1F3B2|nr:uncharacterized protein F4817DRAFT_368043 [Daldinia loculata]KAI1650632.1 hypothetical protein F4817DRAFT_368043 [Daldinia loculata]
MSVMKDIDESRLYCEKHMLMTCKVCLHSVNVANDGTIPKNASGLPRLHGVYVVRPRFQLAHTHDIDRLGYVDGLYPDKERKLPRIDLLKAINNGHPYYDCNACGLTFLAGGGPGSFAAHPSHVCSDGQRYLIARLSVSKFTCDSGKTVCHGSFFFGHKSPSNVHYQCIGKIDTRSAEWNLDNSELGTLIELLLHVEKDIFPHRRDLVDEHVYTNSAYFAGQARRFQLIVITTLSETLLNFLDKVQTLKYSQKRQAYYEKNRFGVVKRMYPATEERRRLISKFIAGLKSLAKLGIPVHWCPGSKSMYEKRVFLNESYVLPPALNESQNDPPAEKDVEPGEDVDEDELIEGDSLEGIPDHDQCQNVEYVPGPEEDAETQDAVWDSLSNPAK